jgi:uncharacterized iron-regulated protein
VSSNLAIYFVCNFLIKNVSKYTLRFVAANTAVSEIRPIKKLQEALVKKYINFPPDMREELLKSNREFLEKQREEKKNFEETGFRPKPSE